jgi:hypothetical protein
MLFFQISGEAAWYNFQPILAPIALNVPAVCDGLAARIRKCAAKTRAAKMWVEVGVGMKRSE